METIQNPREGKISHPVLEKMSIQESPRPPETTKSKSEDEIFGKTFVKMVSGIPECEENYLLKLRQDIINTCFSIN